jgi:hypothetical protein
MPSLAELVPIPPGINPGLSACREDTMLDKFGKPGELADKCSAVTGEIGRRIRYGVDLGPCKVSDLDYATETLGQTFSVLFDEHHDAYSQIKRLVCSVYDASNSILLTIRTTAGHSGSLYFGSGVVPQGKHMTQRGFLDIYETFNQHGWYWGAGFSGGSVDMNRSIRGLCSSRCKAPIPEEGDGCRD